MTLPQRLATYASFVKLEHSIFSLPLIAAGLLLAAHRWPAAGLIALIFLAAVAGRVVGMGLNRLIDADIDARNPRTQRRELPRGAMQRAEGWLVVLVAGVIYAASAWAIAPVCLWLSPIPVLLFVGYPYLKRFTALAHLGLGLAWSMGPLGAWIGARGSLDGLGAALWLWLFSLLWVTGFDIIYATMDEAFDRKARLHSLPVALGKRAALSVAVLLHIGAFAALAAIWYRQLTGPFALGWLVVIGAVMVWQHLVAGRDPAFAFFKLNGAIGFLVLGFILAGI